MKNVLTIFILTFALFNCTNQYETHSNISENEKLVQQYFEHFNKHDWVKMANMYADTSDFKDPSLGQGIFKQTRQQTTEKYSELNKIFPDLHDQLIQTYPSGENNIIVEFISTGTGPDKVKFELPICTIFTIENGFITKDFTYYDNFEQEKPSK